MEVPPGVVTTTHTVPLPLGTIVFICVADIGVNVAVFVDAPNTTLLALPRLVPYIETESFFLPVVLERLVIFGGKPEDELEELVMPDDELLELEEDPPEEELDEEEMHSTACGESVNRV